MSIRPPLMFRIALMLALSFALVGVGFDHRVPHPDDAGKIAFLIDQSSSATAWTSVKRAAEEGRPIPLGWALDSGERVAIEEIRIQPRGGNL